MFLKNFKISICYIYKYKSFKQSYIYIMFNCITDYYLNKKNSKNTDFYSLDGKTFRAKVVDIYDGDTCTVVFKFNGIYTKYKVRMYGYDSSEMKPLKSHPERQKIILNARYAKKQLEDKILNKIVILKCGKWDKYGRLLGTIYTQHYNFLCLHQININDWMVEQDLGKPYFGGKKNTI